MVRKPSCVLLGHDNVPDKVRLDCPCINALLLVTRPGASLGPLLPIHAASPLLLILPPFCYIAAGDQHATGAVRHLSLFKVR